MDVKKVEKTLWFCVLFIFLGRLVQLQQLKGMQNSKLGIPKGYQLSIEGIYTKIAYTRVRGWTLERSLPFQTCPVPHPLPAGSSFLLS